jgi:uncharacterized protein GlcG (DUF336 family)
MRSFECITAVVLAATAAVSTAFAQTSNGATAAVSTGFTQASNGATAAASPGFTQASNGATAAASPGFTQAPNGATAAVSPGFTQAPNGATAAVSPGFTQAPNGATATTPASAPQAQQQPAPAARGPSLEVALDAAQKALKTCKGLDQKIGVTIVDSAGVLKVVLASDGASTRGVASSTNKALTALAFGAATSELGEKIKTDPALAEKFAANANYNSRAGGILLKSGGEIIGAIGVGGAKGSEKDEACAIAGLQKVKSRLR